MTTFTQLDKLTEHSFNNKMRRRGFAVEKKFYFWRKRGPFFDVLWGEIIGGGNSLRIFVTIMCPWIDDPVTGEFIKFPIAECSIGGTLSGRFPEIMRNGENFSVSSEVDITRSLENILKFVDENAIPWFNKIVSLEAYQFYLEKSAYQPDSKDRAKIKKGIVIGLERESF
ncbi:hypothetical protein [Undibacterium sp. Tian12W]|uniref:hypothetical protein n=1 Tax=Undibacterium sp. Tian12W TaxID=3413054 RepID=UPI003BEF6882